MYVFIFLYISSLFVILHYSLHLQHLPIHLCIQVFIRLSFCLYLSIHSFMYLPSFSYFPLFIFLARLPYSVVLFISIIYLLFLSIHVFILFSSAYLFHYSLIFPLIIPLSSTPSSTSCVLPVHVVTCLNTFITYLS